MTTLAYVAVCRSGLSFKRPTLAAPEIVPALRDITDAIHKEGAAASIQIGHCGNMTHYSTAGQIPIGASSGFNLYAYTPVRKMRRDEIMQVSKDFGKAVRTAHAAGFDASRCTPGTLPHLAVPLAYTSHRRDEYGGSLDNRMRFMRMCLEEVMNAAAARHLGTRQAQHVRPISRAASRFPESIEIAREIERWKVNGIVLSGGFVSKAPMAVMRGLIPIYTHELLLAPLVAGLHPLLRPLHDPAVPFSECYFLEDAKKFREALQLPLIYVGGLVSREGIGRLWTPAGSNWCRWLGRS